MIRIPSLKIKLRDNSSGVSEVIGAILLISVVVLAVAIIAVGLFSQPLPQKIPDSRFITEINNNILTIYHDGGEPLYLGEFIVKVNNQPIPENEYTIYPEPTNIWSVGKSLVYTLPSGTVNPKVQIFYNTGSGEVLLDQVRIQPGSTIVPDVMVTPIPPCPACNISNCSQTEIGDAFEQIVMNTSIIFLRADSATKLEPNGVLYFEVTNTSSTLSISGEGLTYLDKGDTVKISLDSSSADFKAFGLGDKFYHLRGDRVNVTVVSTINPSKNFNDKTAILENGWITGYVDLGSTFTINSRSISGQSAYTLLVVNGTTIYNEYTNEQITIAGIRPIGVGLFVLEWDSNGQEGVNFVGDGRVIYG